MSDGGSWLISSQNRSKPAGDTIPSTVLGPVLTLVNRKRTNPAWRDPSDPRPGFRIRLRGRTRLHLPCGECAGAEEEHNCTRGRRQPPPTPLWIARLMESLRVDLWVSGPTPTANVRYLASAPQRRRVFGAPQNPPSMRAAGLALSGCPLDGHAARRRGHCSCRSRNRRNHLAS
jgi:hypothetical protein